MCENTSDFSGVKVGDKLWSVQLGECEVSETSRAGIYRIFCKSKLSEASYTASGLYSEEAAVQSLFWSRPEIIAPPKPRRKVTKTMEAWANVYPDGIILHETALGATQNSTSGCLCQVRLTGTYEVFE